MRHFWQRSGTGLTRVVATTPFKINCRTQKVSVSRSQRRPTRNVPPTFATRAVASFEVHGKADKALTMSIS